MSEINETFLEYMAWFMPPREAPRISSAPALGDGAAPPAAAGVHCRAEAECSSASAGGVSQKAVFCEAQRGRAAPLQPHSQNTGLLRKDAGQ